MRACRVLLPFSFDSNSRLRLIAAMNYSRRVWREELQRNRPVFAPISHVDPREAVVSLQVAVASSYVNVPR